MKFLYEPVTLTSRDEILSFFTKGLIYREENKHESERIARYIFDTTHQSQLQIPLSPDLEQIRVEFGALEAPGLPENDEDINAFTDSLWERLQRMVKNVRK